MPFGGRRHVSSPSRAHAFTVAPLASQSPHIARLSLTQHSVAANHGCLRWPTKSKLDVNTCSVVPPERSHSRPLAPIASHFFYAEHPSSFRWHPFIFLE
ncbi:hypothetical protein AAHC03_020695 [Spirometra sp. Aus1]